MKTELAFLAVAAGLICGQASAGDYVLTIDGTQYELDLGRQATIKLPDGRTLGVTLDKKVIVSFKSEHFSFEHPSQFAPSQTDLGDGISQTMMASALGTVVIVQEYTTMNPSGLIDVVLNELTKEEVQYGYELSKSPSARKLASGAQLKGKVAVSKYKGEEYTRHVLGYESRDAGLLIITQVEKHAPPEDLAMLETFWKSLQISMK